MASKIFITGSSDGLGARAANALIARGHSVFVHGRNASRTNDAKQNCPGAAGAFTADLSITEDVKKLAKELNAKGGWDVIVHNAGIMGDSSTTPEGLGKLFATNTLAPYVLTCLVQPPPKRVVYLSSQLHQGGDASLRNLKHCGYGDSKLHNTMMAFAFARKLPSTETSSLDPGWVKTKMGGSGASDDIEAAVQTYVYLAEGGHGTGRHWYHSRERRCHPEAGDQGKQEKLLRELEGISGVRLS